MECPKCRCKIDVEKEIKTGKYSCDCKETILEVVLNWPYPTEIRSQDHAHA